MVDSEEDCRIISVSAPHGRVVDREIVNAAESSLANVVSSLAPVDT